MKDGSGNRGSLAERTGGLGKACHLLQQAQM